MALPKRPRDPNQLAKSIIDIATGQKPDRDPTRIEVPRCPRAAERKALEKAGVEFIPENGGGAGVRMKKRAGRDRKTRP